MTAPSRLQNPAAGIGFIVIGICFSLILVQFEGG